MRVVGTLPHENQARKLSAYLKDQGILNSCEVSFDPITSQMSYQIWIHDEDQMGEAKKHFDEFVKNSSDPKFNVTIPEPEPVAVEEAIPGPPPPRFKHHLTTILLAICSFVFFLNTMQQANLKEEGISPKEMVLTPIQDELMYDVPETTSFWQGAYTWVVAKVKGETTQKEPLFVKIRQGEVWRLVTPIFLHSDILHILFNMLWLWYLGRPVEQRIGPLRTLILTLTAAVISNTIQYLMSGPFFIGYSGVVMALAGFIWMRERIAPWEGYPLNRGTVLFLLIFIGAIFVLQVIAFFLQLFTQYNLAPNIANTAHIVGAVVGACMARYKFFAQKVAA